MYCYYGLGSIRSNLISIFCYFSIIFHVLFPHHEGSSFSGMPGIPNLKLLKVKKINTSSLTVSNTVFHEYRNEVIQCYGIMEKQAKMLIQINMVQLQNLNPPQIINYYKQLQTFSFQTCLIGIQYKI